MRVALVTYAGMPDLWVDDRLLRDALAARGVTVDAVSWDDPAADWDAYGLTVLRSPWDYPQRRDEFLGWARTVPRLANPYRVVEWNTHKSYLRDLAARGLPVVPTAWYAAGGTADLAALLAERGWAEAVVKPAVSVGGQDTLRFAAGDPAAAQALADRLLAGRDVMVQPYVASVGTTGERSLLYFGGRYSHAVRRPPYLDAGLWADSDPAEAAPDEAELAEAVLAAAGADLLYARVDLVRDEAGAPMLAELEVTEPQLFLRLHPPAADLLAAEIVTPSD